MFRFHPFNVCKPILQITLKVASHRIFTRFSLLSGSLNAGKDGLTALFLFHDALLIFFLVLLVNLPLLLQLAFQTQILFREHHSPLASLFSCILSILLYSTCLERALLVKKWVSIDFFV